MNYNYCIKMAKGVSLPYVVIRKGVEDIIVGAFLTRRLAKVFINIMIITD